MSDRPTHTLFQKMGTWIAICVLALTLSGCAGMRQAERADTIFINGTVYTVDAHDNVEEALAVKDGRILFVGSAEEARALQGPATQIVDVNGKLLLPGFIDAHIHTPGPLAPDLFDINLMGVYEADATLAAIARVVRAHPDKTEYNGFGFAGVAFTGEEGMKGPKKERLDAICADKPMYIFSNDGHAVWVNSKALEVSGIHAQTHAPHGGVIEKNANGEPWGIVKDTAVSLLRITPFARDTLLRTLNTYQKLMNGYGYTAIQSVTASLVPGIDRVPWEALHELEARNALTLRVYGTGGLAPYDNLESKLAEFRSLREQYASDFVRMQTVKCFADGVIDTHTAYLLAPYANAPHTRGEPVWEPEAMRAAFTALNREGFQIHTHAIGDAAVRMTLDAYAAAEQQGGITGLRNTITHLQLVDPADVPRFAAQSIIAGVQPYWHLKQPGYWKELEYPTLGARAEWEYPMRTLLDAGAILASSSDSPVTMTPNPLVAIQIGVTRNVVSGADYGVPDIKDIDDPTWLLNPAERLPVRDMIRSFTANAATAMRAEQHFGSLEPGKWADLVVLDTNILTAPPQDIHKASVLQTYVAGRLVYVKGKE